MHTISDAEPNDLSDNRQFMEGESIKIGISIRAQFIF